MLLFISLVMATVLVVFGGRRRPVTVEPADDLLKVAKTVFKDVIESGEGTSSSTHSNYFYLQVKSDRWDTLVDVVNAATVNDGDVVYLREGTREELSTTSQFTKVHIYIHACMIYC